MRINASNGISSLEYHNRKNNNIGFKSYEPAKAREIEKYLSDKYGMRCEFGTNGFLAECVKETTEIFSNLFDKSYLPWFIKYKNINENKTYARASARVIEFNSKFDDTTYKDINGLRKTVLSHQNLFFPNYISSKHPAHIIVHEFCHQIHWENLASKYGHDKANEIFNNMQKTKIPFSIIKLMTRYDFGNYSVNNDIEEFMAERMSKDICEGLSDDKNFNNKWSPCKPIDIEYNNIFTKKWNNEITCMAAYYDALSQFVWNGNFEKALEATRKMEDIVEKNIINSKTIFGSTPPNPLFEFTKGVVKGMLIVKRLIFNNDDIK